MITILISFLLVAAVISTIVIFVSLRKLRMQMTALLADRDSLLYDPIFDCYNRTGLERRWEEVRDDHGIIFLDLDDLHGANERYGYEGVNERVRAALQHSVRADEVFAGRWYSGDELVICAPKTALIPIAYRAKEAFKAEGLTFIAAISTGYGFYDLLSVVQHASSNVAAAKGTNERDSILIV